MTLLAIAALLAWAYLLLAHGAFWRVAPMLRPAPHGPSVRVAVFWVPLRPAAHTGGAAWAIMALTFIPMLRVCVLSPWRALALPAIATFYMAATIGSAVHYWRVRGVRWKSRDYAMDAA